MYSEISLSHKYLNSQQYSNFVDRLEIIVPLSRTDGLRESRLYRARDATAQDGIIGAGRIDGLLILFINYGEASDWHIEGSLNDHSKLYDSAKKVAESILKKRKSFKDESLKVERRRFFEEGLQRVKILGKVQGWKEVLKESKERQNLVPTILQSLLTAILLYLGLGSPWINSDEPSKLGITACVAMVVMLARVPQFISIAER
jgi:hypothetical protein